MPLQPTILVPTPGLASQTEASPPSERRRPLNGDRLRPVLQMVEAGLQQRLRVAEMARAVALSPFHFSREFRRVMQFSPYAYILERRIARAALLLVESDLPVRDIARAAGFKTHAHFTSVFRKKVGVTPRIYRLRNEPGALLATAPTTLPNIGTVTTLAEQPSRAAA